MTIEERLDRLERAAGEMQREWRELTGFTPRGQHDFIDLPPCEHEYEMTLAGGDPAEASSTERIVVCKKCGEEAE